MDNSSYGQTDRVDCSWLSVTAEGQDTFLVGNGTTFVEVPAVAVDALNATAGRTLEEARAFVLAKTGMDVDVVDFLNTLRETGVLARVETRNNVWDHISPRAVSWLFAKRLWVCFGMIVAAAICVLLLSLLRSLWRG